MFGQEQGPVVAGGSGLFGGWGDSAFVAGVKEFVDDLVAEWEVRCCGECGGKGCGEVVMVVEEETYAQDQGAEGRDGC